MKHELSQFEIDQFIKEIDQRPVGEARILIRCPDCKTETTRFFLRSDAKVFIRIIDKSNNILVNGGFQKGLNLVCLSCGGRFYSDYENNKPRE